MILVPRLNIKFRNTSKTQFWTYSLPQKFIFIRKGLRPFPRMTFPRTDILSNDWWPIPFNYIFCAGETVSNFNLVLGTSGLSPYRFDLDDFKWICPLHGVTSAAKKVPFSLQIRIECNSKFTSTYTFDLCSHRPPLLENVRCQSTVAGREPSCALAITRIYDF